MTDSPAALGGAVGSTPLAASRSSSPHDATPFTDARLLSFNQATAERASLREVVESCARHEVPYVSLWRHKIAETGLERLPWWNVSRTDGRRASGAHR
jgi:hypothetical protein